MFSIRYLLLVTLFFNSVFVSKSVAQTIKKDTSFTVYSAFKKEQNKFPNIKPVQQQSYKNVKEDKGIAYKNTGTRNLQLDAFYAKCNKNPAVIMIHGGGWKSGSKEHMHPMAAKIANKGYSCFAVEYRLSDEATYPAGIIDVKNAIQYIKLNAKKYHVDTTKIAVLGCSSGGQMAALVGTTNKDTAYVKNSPSAGVQAIVDIDGVLAFKHPESMEGDMASWWLGGTYKEIPSVWEEASALYRTDKNTPPILFINSQYPRFHAGRDDMIKILNTHGTYSEVRTIPNSPHPFWLLHPWFDTTTKYIVNFLDKTLKNNP